MAYESKAGFLISLEKRMAEEMTAGNKDKADLFCKWFKYIVGLIDDRREVKWDDG